MSKTITTEQLRGILNDWLNAHYARPATPENMFEYFARRLNDHFADPNQLKQYDDFRGTSALKLDQSDNVACAEPSVQDAVLQDITNLFSQVKGLGDAFSKDITRLEKRLGPEQITWEDVIGNRPLGLTQRLDDISRGQQSNTKRLNQLELQIVALKTKRKARR
jgi:hypothetical protein